MVIHLTPELEAELQHQADLGGRTTDELAQEALASYLHYHAEHIRAVQEGLDALARGEVISHEEVFAKLERLYPEK